ncbi:hypothetical protein [Polluticoccus soli]|uniref:hypothetical protein n=1 Tax=Polluticoccus soli TaxID=3034150 RepID=UPI0023E26EE9|nr:hypothetical protein [Flavipsychrobacter sp. JY13-12]
MTSEQGQDYYVPKPDTRCKLFLAGDKDQHIGWVEVYNGVNVVEYIVDRNTIESSRGALLILSLGDSLKKDEYFGAFDVSKHKLPY